MLGELVISLQAVEAVQAVHPDESTWVQRRSSIWPRGRLTTTTIGEFITSVQPHGNIVTRSH
jgi:hypothetical protein